MAHRRHAPTPAAALLAAVLGVLAAIAAPAASFARAASAAPPRPPDPVAPHPAGGVSSAACALLDDPEARGTMSALLVKLLLACGRGDELRPAAPPETRPPPEPGAPPAGPAAAPAGPAAPGGPAVADVLVNDPTGDSGISHTQSETSVAYDPVTRTFCAGYNDSFHAIVEGRGFSGFSRSVDGGATWEDRGPHGVGSRGDPSVVWRRADGHFYFFAVETLGIGVWRSTDGCRTFSFLGRSHVSDGDDKELAAVDNDPASPFYGRLYVAWKDSLAAARIYVNSSDDGGETWSEAVAASAPPPHTVQGAWPAVAPGGDLYVGWVYWNPFPTVIEIELVRSTDGGATFTPLANPMTGEDAPLEAAASAACGRAALNGRIRYLPSPQVAVGPDGAVHVAYSYDPDGAVHVAYSYDPDGARIGGGGDVVDSFYRRSTDFGATWGPEIRLNDDATATDQFFPSLSVGESNAVVAAWYDRRLDPGGNLLFDYFSRLSLDGGVTWEPSERVSDVSSPVYIDPNLSICYHGDYDQQLQTPGFAHLLWSDERNLQGGHPDPDVWSQAVPAGTDFLLVPTPPSQGVCAPDDALFAVDVPQFRGFAEPVSLAAAGHPAGTTAAFDPDPVVPPGSTTLAVSGTGGAAPGSYPLTLTGTSSPGGVVHQATATLDLYDGAPAAPALVAPPDGAVGLPLGPTLVWAPAAQGALYHLEVATDAAFTRVVYAATLAGTERAVEAVLAPRTRHFWRVRAVNACGEGAFSAAFAFTTQAVPPILLVDDDDNDPDVRALFADALAALGRAYGVWDTEVTDREPPPELLVHYRTVVWFTGGSFGGFAGPGGAAEGALGGWLDGGGRCLFLTSQDYHYDRGLTPFMQGYLGVASVANDTRHEVVTGEGAYAGLGPYPFGHPFVNFSDTLFPNAQGEVAFTGDRGTAALRKAVDAYRTVFFGFGFEALPAPADRARVLARLLADCDAVTLPIFADGFEKGDLSAWSATAP